MRLGLIGVGRIGRRHIRILQEIEAVRQVVVADAEPDRAEHAAAALGVSAVPGVDELFAQRPDGVVIAAPTPTHAGLVRRAVAAGTPVFCEKPLAPDVAGTQELIAELDRAGVPLQMGFQRRFDPGFLAARERLRSDDLGWLHSVWACTLDPAPPHPSYIPDSGGLFRDCSVHDIDAIRWATGREVVEVYATGGNRGASWFADAGDVDTAHALLTLDDGTLATIVASRYNGGGYEGRLELHGSRATAVAGLDGVQDVAYAGFADRFGAAYTAELRAFTELVAGKIDSPCSGEDAREALRVADACERSRAGHRPVRLTAEVGGPEER